MAPQRGVAYEYQVAGVAPSGTAASRWSKYFAPPAPVAPIVTVLPAGDRSTISWTATTGAAAYNVERMQLDATGQPVGVAMILNRRMMVQGPTFSDATLAPSTTYRYKVTTLFADNTVMPSRAVDFAAPAFRTPASVLVAGGGGRVGISWCAAAGVVGYVVNRRTVRADGSVVDASQRTPQSITATSFVDDLPTPASSTSTRWSRSAPISRSGPLPGFDIRQEPGELNRIRQRHGAGTCRPRPFGNPPIPTLVSPERGDGVGRGRIISFAASEGHR